MGNTVKNAAENIKEISKDNPDMKRKKRFAKYSLLGINKKVNQQIKRDFTVDTENKLIILANSVNSNEFSYDLIDVLGRWFLNTFIGKLLKNIINTQKVICDSYNYFGKTIKEIFNQARATDEKYSNKISNAPKTIAESSVKLLSKLNESFSYYENNKEYGCNISYALTYLYENYNETIEIKEKLLSANESKKIEDFVSNDDNLEIFDEYSNKIYEEYGIDDQSFSNSKLSKLIQGKEDIINKIVPLFLKKFNSEFEKNIEGDLINIFEDEDVASSLSELIKASGVTGAIEGTLKLYVLKQSKDAISKNYKVLFNKIHSGKSEDYKTLKLLYEQLKSLETNIIKTYREINEFNPDKQVEANEWLGEIQEADCGSLS